MHLGGGKKKKAEDPDAKRREQQEAAKVYAEFVQAFQGDADEPPKTFVRGGTYEPGKGGEVKVGKGEKYKPPVKKGLWLPPASAALQAKKRDGERESGFSDGPRGFSDGPLVPRVASAPAPAPAPSEQPQRKTRQIDDFLEEIKAKQRYQEERKAVKAQIDAAESAEEKDRLATRLKDIDNAIEGGPGGIDVNGVSILRRATPSSYTADETTNLYIGNLSPEITEEFLAQQFGKHGSVASIKIMYPRTDEERARGRHCGFVSFETRPQAEAAKNALDGQEFYGMVIRIGWGKPIPKPVVGPTPAQIGAPPASAAIEAPLAGTGAFGSGGFSDKPPESKVVPTIEVVPPADKKVQTLIDILAKYVAEDGHPFEQLLMERESAEGRFAFLFHKDSTGNVYYRWRVWAYAQGDTRKSWRTEPFHIFIGGSLWKPPPNEEAEERQKTNFSSQPPTEAPTKAAMGKDTSQPAPRTFVSGGVELSLREKEDLDERIRELTKERASICEAMVWALERADSANAIVDILSAAIVADDVPLDDKMARLYLLSDVLFNSCCTTRAAWAYRTAVEKKLPDMVEHLTAVYQGISGRITATQMRETILRMFRVWEQWAVFPIEYTKGLEMTFNRKKGEFVFEDPPSPEPSDDDLDGEPIIDPLAKYPDFIRDKVQMWEAMDVSQLERTCHQHGLSSRPTGDRAKMVDRLVAFQLYWKRENELNRADIEASGEDIDGLPLDGTEELDIDGEAIDDIDGEPIQVAPPPELEHPGEVPPWLLPQALSGLAARRPLPPVPPVAKKPWPAIPTLPLAPGVLHAALAEDDFDTLPVAPGVGEEGLPSADLALPAPAAVAIEVAATSGGAGDGADKGEKDEEMLDIEKQVDDDQDIFAGPDDDDIFRDPNEVANTATEQTAVSKKTAAGGDKESAEEQRRRAKLRQVEVDVMKLQVELEKRGALDPDTITLRCDERRQQLIADIEREAREEVLRKNPQLEALLSKQPPIERPPPAPPAPPSSTSAPAAGSGDGDRAASKGQVAPEVAFRIGGSRTDDRGSSRRSDSGGRDRDKDRDNQQHPAERLRESDRKRKWEQTTRSGRKDDDDSGRRRSRWAHK